MLEEILSLAKELEIGDGGLLKLARDIAHNGRLRTIDRLTTEERAELLTFLQKAHAPVHA